MKSLTTNNLMSVTTVTVSNLKLKLFISGLITAYGFLFNPLKTPLYIAVGVLVVFDFLTALVAALKNREIITSAKCSRTILKMFVYGIMISAATMADRFIIDQGQIFADLMLAFVAITEFISIIENVNKTGIDTPVNILKRLKSIRNKDL